ncbi:MAG: hypothetical protein ABI162_00515 [Luteolibacter sp.]
MGDALDGVAFALIDGLDGMRENPEIVRRGDADAGVAMINSECRMWGS